MKTRPPNPGFYTPPQYQQPTMGFYQPNWQQMYGPSLNNAQVVAHQSNQAMADPRGPIQRGIGNFMNRFRGNGQGGGPMSNFMQNAARGRQARRGMGSFMNPF